MNEKYTNLTKQELKEELRKRELETDGTVADLIARLEESDGEDKQPDGQEPGGIDGPAEVESVRQSEPPAEPSLEEPKTKTREEVDKEKTEREKKEQDRIKELEARLATLEARHRLEIAKEMAGEKPDLSKIDPDTAKPEDLVRLINNEPFIWVDKVYREGKALTMLRALAKQPKEPLFVPLDGKERPGVAALPVQLNGCQIWVKKGTMVYVPRQIRDVVYESMRLTAEALNPMAPEITGGDVIHKGGPLRMDQKDDAALAALSR